MAEKTRIRLVRISFLVFCIVPTIVVMAWAVARAAVDQPIDKSLWEDELSRLLGVDVSIQAVARPEKGRTLLQGVGLSDPESGPLARIRTVELARTNRGIELVASQPEVRAEGIARIGELLHDRALRTRRETDLPIHVSAAELTVHNGGAKQGTHAETLLDVDAWIVASEAGPQFSITFRNAASDTQSEFHLLRKNRLVDRPTTYWRLETPSAPLPCWLVKNQFPSLARLGPQSSFTGRIWGEETAGGWQGELDGRFENIDLYRLVTGQFPQLLNGTADINATATVRDGRLAVANGSIQSGGGTIGRNLIEAACKSFPLDCPSLAGTTDKNWRFDELQIRFDINRDGIKLSGGCDPLGNDLLTDSDGPLVSRTGGDRVSAVALAEVMTRTESSQARVTSEGQALLEVLPLPEILRTVGSAPEATIRLP